MRGKNNKGFTLIEIIAVIVILGILSIMVIPKVYDLFTDSRKSIYIEDAIRLISQAQFTMSSKSMKIDKPENGECIVFSMKYLSTNDFQNPPNGGIYLSESSFVLVKNVNGNYIYSTMIVEKTKDDVYMGVELTTEKGLNAKDALKHVRTFNISEIGYFDDGEWSEGSLIDAAFVNGNVKTADGEDAGDWQIDSEDIIGYYNNERGEDVAVVDTASPKITTKFSTSGSLQTVLTIAAKDEDTELSKLKVCIKISSNKDDSYPSATDSSCEGYGNSNYYEKSINFADYGFSYANRSTAYVYVLVVDDTNNMTRKRLSYDVHENEPPKINNYTITKLSGDKQNMPKAAVKLALTDDMTSIDNLQICFVQDNEDAQNCSNYASYLSLFGNSGVYNYTFKDSNGADITKPDGSSHSLKVFVKDEKGLVVTAVKDYTIYSNKEPSISLGAFGTSCLFSSNGRCTCKTANCNSLTVTVNLSVDDDLTDPDDLLLTFYHLASDGSTHKGEITMTYSQFKSGDRKYTFTGEYDGEDRELYVTVKDGHGKTKTSSRKLEDVYKDLPPSIVLLKDENNNNLPFITSAEFACSGADSCTNLDNGGSYRVNLNFDVVDDLTSADDVTVCVSEDPDYCTDEDSDKSHFKKFSSFDKEFEFSTNITNGKIYPTEQLTKELYVAVKDGKGHYTAYKNLEPIKYKLYHNAAPIVSGSYQIVSSDEDVRNSVDENGNPIEGYEGGLPKVAINLGNISIVDDFVDYEARFCYTIDDSEEICTSYKDFIDLKDTLGSEFVFKDGDGNAILNEGQKITTRVDIKDNYDLVKSTPELVYDIYKDKPPEIVSSSIKSVTDDYNSYNIDVEFTVRDYQDKYKVCITEDESCGDADYIGNEVGASICNDTNGDGEETEDECEETTNEELFDGSSNTGYELIIDGSVKFHWSATYQNENPNKHLKLFVKDTYGNVKSVDLKNNGSTTYSLYELCSIPENRQETDDPPTFEYISGTEISPSDCSGACYRNYKTTNNTSHPNFHTGSTETDDGPIAGLYKKTLKYEDTLVGVTCDGISEDVQLRCDNVRCFNTGEEENPNIIALKLEDEDMKWYYSNSRVTKEVEIAKPYCENLNEEADFFHPNDIRCEDVDSLCYAKATNVCKPYIDQYEQEVAAYELAKAEYVAQQVLYDYNHDLISDTNNMEEDIDTCTPLLPNLGSDSWIASRQLYCENQADCFACQNGTNSENVDCSMYQVGEDNQIVCELVDGSYQDKVCTALRSLERCQSVYDMFQDSIEIYTKEFEDNPANVKPTQTTCIEEQQTVCKGKYNFCSQPFTELYKEVSCDASHDLDVTCRKSDFYDGHCLVSDTTCTGDDPDCVEVCYRHHDCTSQSVTRPVTFTCTGYFPTYRSEVVNNNIILKKTPIRICPEFYYGFFDQIYAYNNDTTTPYVRFNPEEIEIDPELTATNVDEGDGDDGD